MGTILIGAENRCQSRSIGGVIVVTRFRVPPAEADAFAASLAEAHEVLADQRGYLGGGVGRNVDDPELWVLQTSWEGPGAYRRALSASDVKTRAWALLSRALDEPSAYEVVDPTGTMNQPRPRGADPAR